MKTDGTLNTTDKIMKNQKETQEMMVKVMESMYKTEQSHQTTLETMLKIAETLKKLNDKFDKFIGSEAKSNPNEGVVLDEETILGDMRHLIIGFGKEVGDVDLERMKQECESTYNMDVAFACMLDKKTAEVFLQPRKTNENE